MTPCQFLVAYLVWEMCEAESTPVVYQPPLEISDEFKGPYALLRKGY